MKRTFTFFQLPLQSRIIFAGLLYAVCVFAQIISGAFFLGMFLVLPAWLLLWMKNISNKPDDQGLENWRAVGEAEVHRIADHIAETKKLSLRLGVPGVLRVVLLALVIGAAVILHSSYGYATLALVDLAVFSLPAVFSGMVMLHMPSELHTKLNCFLPLMNSSRPESLVFTPYIRFDEDPDKNDIPEDLRFMLEPRRKPDELVGVQLQVTMNEGPNGEVPYMYAVVLFHGRDSRLYREFSSLQLPGFVVEPGGDDDYGTVVIRQQTSGTGYHTKTEDCLRLYQQLQDLLLKSIPV